MRETVPYLLGLIVQGSRSLLVRQVAESVIRQVPSKDYVGELRALHDWVDTHVRFTRDPAGTERFVTADRTLQGIFTDGLAFLDCDDYSILLGSMLKSVGFPVRVNVVGTKGPWPHHVYVSAKAGNRWYGLDPAARFHPRSWSFREVSVV